MSQLRVIEIFQEMSDHTKDECAKCRIPHSCCDAHHCRDTITYAKSAYGVTLEPTGHPTLPLMGESGCIAAPHYRPICTVHTCDIYMYGCKPGDNVWTDRYFELRDAGNDALKKAFFSQ